MTTATLYVTLSTGIARVDTEYRPADEITATRHGGDRKPATDLYWHDGDLLGVQNVTNPGRVIRIALDGERPSDCGYHGVAVASSP